MPTYNDLPEDLPGIKYAFWYCFFNRNPGRHWDFYQRAHLALPQVVKK
jgi:hypothetical protein